MNARGVCLGLLTRLRAACLTRDLGRWRVRSGGVAAVFAVALGVGMTVSLSALFRTLATQGATAADAARLLGMLYDATVLGTLVFDLHATLATLLLAPDLELLRRAPLRPQQILALKWLDAFPVASTMVFTLAIPATVGYALAYGTGIQFMLAPLVLIALGTIPLGLGIVGAAGLMRLAPATRVRESLGILTTLVLVLLWLANTFLLPRATLLGPDGAAALPGVLAAIPASHVLSPGHWAVTALTAAWPSATMALSALLGGAALSLGLTSGLGARILTAGAVVRAAPAHTRPPDRVTFTLSRTRAFLARDFALFARDWTVLIDVVVAAILWTLLPVAFVPVVPMDPELLASTMLMALTVGLGHEVASRALPLERHALHWAHVAPVGPTRWVLLRFLGVLLITAPLYLLAWIAISLATGISASAAATVLVIGTGPMLTAIALGFWVGARYGDPDWSHPRGMLTPAGRLVAMFVLLSQAGGWLALRGGLENLGGPVALSGTILVAWMATIAALAGASRVLRQASRQGD